MAYNLSNLTSSNNLLEYAVATNGLVDGMLFVVVLSLVLIISFVGMKRFPAANALLSSTFVTFVLATILWTVGLVSDTVAVVFFVFFALSLGAKILLQ